MFGSVCTFSGSTSWEVLHGFIGSWAILILLALARVTGLRLASPGRNEGSELSKTAPAAVFGSQGPIASAAKSNAVEHVQIESLWE